MFSKDGILYRQVSSSYREHYDLLMKSGLYTALVDEGLLVSHVEMDSIEPPADEYYKVIKPEPVRFVSYPYEWCFSQLKDAALLTLKAMRKSIEYGMVLKDASAYNIQFIGSRPVMIDTLSFEKYVEGRPWVGYRQFCQHFLAPLALMKYRDIRFSQFLRAYIDGIPLDFASSALPFITKMKLSLLFHIHLHSKFQKGYSDKGKNIDKSKKVSHVGFLGTLDSLETAIRSLTWKHSETEWGNYYSFTNYDEESFEHKRSLVGNYLKHTGSGMVFDLGGNRGEFSKVASDLGRYTVSLDIDPVAVETNYINCKNSGETGLLPLLHDLSNPSPALGWAHEERMSLTERGPADTVLALALIHHLAISNNLPLNKIASWFASLGESLIIEFVPKEDSQTQILLSSREDIFTDYNENAFKEAFSKHFTILESEKIKHSHRTLYLMRKK